MICLLLTALALFHVCLCSNEYDKRAPSFSNFDTLGGMGLGKRSTINAFDSLGGLGFGKRSGAHVHFSGFDSLGGMGFGKRSTDVEDKRSAQYQFSGFDTLGGIGFGKRSGNEQIPVTSGTAGDKRASFGTFDSLGGMGLGKRSMPLFYRNP